MRAFATGGPSTDTTLMDHSDDSDDFTGGSTSALTQDLGDLDLVGNPPGLAHPSSWIEITFAHFVEQEAIKHVPLVAAAAGGTAATTASPPLPRATPGPG